ncbi:hypothetical protein F8M41_025213 [Gigaspora margarita]|uniref:Uncharacterized protein n=1 Tax=Gigaspora margarita TaxID=4874 RepID=A0A8H4ETA6_GIGMA|nr:hypothetical protein F8M41_025213 [Gigaspora margarita]
MSSVYKFDSKTLQWTIPAINNFNSSFTSHNTIQAIIDNNGKIFIFGGYDYINPTMTPIYNVYNNMNNLLSPLCLGQHQLNLSLPLATTHILLYYCQMALLFILAGVVVQIQAQVILIWFKYGIIILLFYESYNVQIFF